MAVKRQRRSMPAVLMRAGTSKGLFIHRAHLPISESDWATPLLAAMGSRYADAKQIDGIGGASSVTSKVAVVAPSTRDGIDVEYTFVQVAVGSEAVDLSGNCGNMVSGVGPFAVQEGLVTPTPGESTVDVRILNTNTNKVIVETIAVDEDGEVIEDGDCHIPGVAAPGSAVKVAFVEPAGSMTGVMFPTGKLSETIHVEDITAIDDFNVEVTCVDCANPFVLVDGTSLPRALRGSHADESLRAEAIEAIRQRGAVLMGLAASPEDAAQVRGTPKIAIVNKPADPSKSDIHVLAYSMGKPHPSLQLTGGVCLASAACIEGTVLHRLRNTEVLPSGVLTPARTPSPSSPAERPVQFRDELSKEEVRLEHGRGIMAMEIWKRRGKDGVEIERGIGIRTARRLFEGNVFYYM
ncbi:methylitaconate delta2-delta3-isomerase [Plectosphaerella plurivora]|uniref:Methylitaconate delta2-delta3-isomerase n=1 Tax=Plectosphaerella plurivora TaxID=936078 RepID=A0A9P9A8C7_9PEZI|nr:methylitaconate delta2-delta3-isomerase [Plectosphaerella plurivora]